jgi:hypothetical protein
LEFAAHKSRKIKERLAREPASLSVKENYQAIGILGLTPNAVKRIAACNIKIPRERCSKATNSKAVGGPPRLTALPSSPYVPPDTLGCRTGRGERDYNLAVSDKANVSRCRDFFTAVKCRT